MAQTASSWVRPPAVAGTFYPADAGELRAAVRRMLDQAALAASQAILPGAWPKAIIAPHAGYVFSGPVAASVYRTLEPARGKISRVVLLGPSHRVAFDGLASSTASHFATPLGPVKLDRAAIDSLADLPFVSLLDPAHAREHSLEVHLPFLLEVLGGFALVPLVIGDATSPQVAEVLSRLWGGPETLIVISSDLSHYHPYAEAVELDAAAARAIQGLRPDDLSSRQACGCVAIRGLLSLASERGLSAQTVDLRNSADTAPKLAGRDQVVGYGAWAFIEEKGPGTRAQGLGEELGEGLGSRVSGLGKEVPAPAPNDAKPPDSSLPDPRPQTPDPLLPQASRLKPQAGATLLAVARQSIEHGLATGRPLPVAVDDFDAPLRVKRASFVTLHLPGVSGNELRGCIGTLEARRPLIEDIAHNAFAAAFRDPRFPPVTAAEAPLLQIHLSLLTAPQPLTFTSEEDLLSQLRPQIDGLILEEPRAGRRGTFLPAVWESLPDPREFLNHLKQKAGLPADYWSDTLRAYRYEAESI